jgi:hypothetical protein
MHKWVRRGAVDRCCHYAAPAPHATAGGCGGYDLPSSVIWERQMTIAYTAIETLDPSWGETWTNYVGCSGLDHLKEVVSLDCLLCPSIIEGALLTEEDWNYIVLEEVVGTFFCDVDYLLSRIRAESQQQVIAVLREPTESDVLSYSDDRFQFKGYDLVEDQTGISALTNCGGFDLAFSNDDLSECGLVSEHERAYRIRDLLRKHYPDEPHANCAVWAIWKMGHAKAE